MNATAAATQPVARLLLVDDEESILNSLRRLFRPDGYHIDATTNPEQALEWITQHAYDVVISDMRMPVMDGATLLQAIAEFAPKTIRLLLTGYSEQESTVRAINLGRIHAYLSKPWQNDDLRQRVKDALQTKARADEQEKMMSRLRFVNEKLGQANRELHDNLKYKDAELEQATAFLDCAHEELKGSYSSVISAFTHMLNQRLPAELNIAPAVEKDAVALMKKLGGDDSQLAMIRHAAQLFQMGKFGLSDVILVTPYYRLSDDEREQYNAYPTQIDSGLRVIDALKPVIQIIEHHQELYNGQGYPSGFFGSAIPFGARVLKPIIDYHMLLNGQLDPTLATPHDAQQYLISHADKHYDPQIVAVYLDYLRESQTQDAELADVLIASAADTGFDRLLARDLFSADGMLLLAKGSLTNAALMQRLREWEVRQGQPLYMVTKPAAR